MPDIVVTWGLDRSEFWDYDVTDEEIANEWGPWKLKTHLPELHSMNKVYICHNKKIKGYNTIREIWVDENRTQMKIFCKSWVKVDPIPIKRCNQGFRYFQNVKRDPAQTSEY